jgi:phosphate:Na+ symporter
VTADALTAAGGIGLFLLGMSVMTRGLRELGGDALTRALRRFTKSPLSGCVTGAVGTALLQSSSATTVAAIGFVGAGVLTFAQALGVILGANVGTTITGWLVALLGFKLDLGLIAYPLVLAGALLHLFGRRGLSAAGAALAGFAVIFLGIGVLQQGLAAFRGTVTPTDFPPDTWIGRAGLLGIGVLITVVTQSSSAGVALALTALHTGTVGFGQAGALVIGMDVGTTVTAALATIGSTAAGRRTGLAHVVFNGMTGVMAYALLPVYVLALGGGLLARQPEIALVAFHSAFNLLGVVLVLPLAGRFAHLMERLVPVPSASLTRSLEPALQTEPRLALEAILEALRAAAREAFGVVARLQRHGGSPETAARALQTADAALADVRRYLARVAGTADRPELARRHDSLVHALDHLERLVARAERREGADLARRDPRLAADALRLAEAAERAERDLDEAAADAAGVLVQELAADKDVYRAEVVRRMTAGNLSTDEALERLDEVRQIRRIAHHVHRATHHLARAGAPKAPPTEETARAEVAPE